MLNRELEGWNSTQGMGLQFLLPTPHRVVAASRLYASENSSGGISSSAHPTTRERTHVPQLQYRQAATHLSLHQLHCIGLLPTCHLSSQRFVASNTARTLAVSALSRTSALPVANELSLVPRIVTPTNTKFRSNASISLHPSSANTRTSNSACRIAASAARAASSIRMR